MGLDWFGRYYEDELSGASDSWERDIGYTPQKAYMEQDYGFNEVPGYISLKWASKDDPNAEEECTAASASLL